MNIQLQRHHQSNADADSIIVVKDNTEIDAFSDSDEENAYIRRQLHEKRDPVLINRYTRRLIFINNTLAQGKTNGQEHLRRKGHDAVQLLKNEQVTDVQIIDPADEADTLLAFTEGLLLSLYRFDKYKSKPASYRLQGLTLVSEQVDDKAVEALQHLSQGVYTARDLVNEPLIELTAERLSERLQELGQAAGFQTEVFDQKKIQELKMGGLLAVAEGAPNPPTFNILEYKPENPVNKQPIVLVGKGVVYDTGGLSLKPTEGSMEFMKSDMGGAAAVAGTFEAVARQQLPLHIVGLIPAVENRPDGNAYTPGDVITMYDGSTVEVMNTDAEGRLILADALHYAKSYQPELVIDAATLTGSAARMLGKEGVALMSTASRQDTRALIEAGMQVHERPVELPLWEEYKEYLTSDIADQKNVGGPAAGAITAGKFMEPFTDYPWMHLDIAGMAFLKQADSYRGTGGTGVGVRLLTTFLRNRTVS